MPGYLRIFQSAVSPSDAEEVRRLFVDDVKPIFEDMAGCLGIELVVSVEMTAGGLMEGAVVTRWESREAMEAAVGSRAVKEAIVRFRDLLRQEPLAKVYEIAA